MFVPQDNNRRQDHAGNGQIQNNDSVQQQGAVPVPIHPDSGTSSVNIHHLFEGSLSIAITFSCFLAVFLH